MITSMKKNKGKEGVLRVLSFFCRMITKASLMRGHLSRDSGATEQWSHADSGARTSQWKKQVQRSQGERVLLSGNDKRTNVLGAVAKTQKEGREVAGDQSHRAFGHGDDHELYSD